MCVCIYFCSYIDEYNKEGLAQAFVKFLERESQPRSATGAQQSPTLLNITTMARSSPVNVVAAPTPVPVIASSAANNNSSEAAVVEATPPTTTIVQPVQPILLSEGLLMQNFAPTRNSSSILKDILNDS